MNEPLATAAGNALEVRNAVDFLTGAHRTPRCCEVTLALARRRARDDRLSRAMRAPRSEPRSTSGKATEHFAQMVDAARRPRRFRRAHGPAPDARADRPRRLRRRARAPSPRSTPAASAWAVVALGGGRRLPTDTIDHAVGFDRLARARRDGRTPGTPLARIHARDEVDAPQKPKPASLPPIASATNRRCIPSSSTGSIP